METLNGLEIKDFLNIVNQIHTKIDSSMSSVNKSIRNMEDDLNKISLTCAKHQGEYHSVLDKLNDRITAHCSDNNKHVNIEHQELYTRLKKNNVNGTRFKIKSFLHSFWLF